jgi:molybdopterin-guanine dinucleotide biosynthesis protein A
MKNSFGFFTACDTPFLQKPLVALLLEKMDGQTDIIMPETAAGLEPLCAIYSKRCLNTAEHHIKQDKFKIQRALGGHRWKKIPESKLRSKDPELKSFFNINTPQEMAQAEKMAAKGGAHRA